MEEGKTTVHLLLEQRMSSWGSTRKGCSTLQVGGKGKMYGLLHCEERDTEKSSR